MWSVMRRVERKLFRVNDELAALAEEERRLAAELAEHERLHHDARLDAVDGSADERAAFKEIEADLPRFQRALSQVRRRQGELLEQRARLLAKLG